MGNQPSAHQPLERGFRRAASFRFSRRERSGGQAPAKRMDRIRRSFRDSFRRRRDAPESSRPHQWQADESAVRSGNCAFPVKYLGYTQVNDSRGMQTCEEALKTLRMSRRRPIRAILHVSGDGLRVVDDETRDLIVDQTIEKVSFCAPDRNCEKGFSYICRDGTTKRWICHGFFAIKESGDRLSHAVGCAFAVCLERKQRRDTECTVSMTFDQRTATFTRQGSFRQASLTERMQEPQERNVDSPPVRQIHNPYAIERPHATPSMLERQGSFRGFDQLNHASPFKRQLSLRVNDLPSNYERVRSHSLEPTDLSRLPSILSHQQIPNRPPEYEGYEEVSPIPEISPTGQDSVAALCQQVTRDLSLLSSDDFGSVLRANTAAVNRFNITSTMTTTAASSIIPGVSSSSSLDNLRLPNGFVELTSSKNNNGSSFKSGVYNNNNNVNNNNRNNNNIDADEKPVRDDGPSWQESASSSSVVSSAAAVNARLTPILNQCCPSLSPVLPRSSLTGTPPHGLPASTMPSIFDTPAASPVFSTTSTSSLASSSNAALGQRLNRSPVQPPQLISSSLQATLADSPRGSLPSSLSPSPAQLSSTTPVPASAPTPTPAPTTTTPTPIIASGSTTAATSSDIFTPASVFENSESHQTPPVASVQPVLSSTDLPKPDQWLGSVTTQATVVPPPVAPRRAPPLQARAMSLGSAMVNPTPARQGPADPFDSDWVDSVARKQPPATNPFILPNTTQAFQVQL